MLIDTQSLAGNPGGAIIPQDITSYFHEFVFSWIDVANHVNKSAIRFASRCSSNENRALWQGPTLPGRISGRLQSGVRVITQSEDDSLSADRKHRSERWQHRLSLRAIDSRRSVSEPGFDLRGSDHLRSGWRLCWRVINKNAGC